MWLGVTIVNAIGTALRMFSFDGMQKTASLCLHAPLRFTSGFRNCAAPVVTNLGGVVNFAPSGSSQPLSVSGMNFGSVDLSAVLGGGVGCSRMSWTSTTAIACESRQGALGYWWWEGARTGTFVAIPLSPRLSLEGTASAPLTYDAPVMTFLVPKNFPQLGGATVTISGTNFGPVDLSANAQVGISPCGTASWTTGTSLRCLTPRGWAAAVGANVVVSTLSGTDVRASFDLMYVSNDPWCVRSSSG